MFRIRDLLAVAALAVASVCAAPAPAQTIIDELVERQGTTRA